MTQIRLSDAIENLRQELKLAQRRGEGEHLQFKVSSIEVELEVVAESDAGGSGKINWMVFSGGIDIKEKDVHKHKLKLNLQPAIDGGADLNVSQQKSYRPE
jgi:Trypsin-co-occurring domain 2